MPLAECHILVPPANTLQAHLRVRLFSLRSALSRGDHDHGDFAHFMRFALFRVPPSNTPPSSKTGSACANTDAAFAGFLLRCQICGTCPQIWRHLCAGKVPRCSGTHQKTAFVQMNFANRTSCKSFAGHFFIGNASRYGRRTESRRNPTISPFFIFPRPKSFWGFSGGFFQKSLLKGLHKVQSRIGATPQKAPSPPFPFGKICRSPQGGRKKCSTYILFCACRN